MALSSTDTSAHNEWHQSLPVLIAIAVFSIIGVAPFVPLFDLDEGAFTEATREMLASGNWVSTYLNGEPRHDKPILIYWLQATSASLFGFNEFALRLPSILCAFAWLFVVYRFCREFWSESVAKTALLILSTAWLAVPIFKAAIADALLNWLICLTFFDMYRYSQDPKTSRLFRLGVVIGLGFLTKGPIAIVLPLGSFFFALAYKRDLRTWFNAVLHPASWLSFLVIITPWHIAVYMDQGWGFFEGFYLGHNVGRFSNTMEKHGGSVFYYAALLPLLILPFTKQLVMLPTFLRRFVAPTAPSLMYSMLAVWFFITLLIFSFSQTQLPHYLLYGLTPVFICIAAKLHDSKTKIGTIDISIAAAGTLLLTLFPLLLPYALPQIKPAYEFALTEHINELYQNRYIWVSLAISVLVIASVCLLTKATAKLLAMSVLMAANINFMLMPLMAEGQQSTVKQAASIANAYLETTTAQKTTLVAYKVNMPSISVYTQRIVTKQSPKLGDIIFTRVHAIPDLKQIDPTVILEELYNKGGIVLIRYGQPK